MFVQGDIKYIVMVHMAEEFNFAQSPFSINPVIENISNFLNRDLFLCFRICSATATSKLNHLVIKSRENV